MTFAGSLPNACLAIALMLRVSLAVAQEPPPAGQRFVPVPRVGAFTLDAAYPKNSTNPSLGFNFGVVVQQLPLPQEVVYFLFEPDTDVFEEARRKGLTVLSRMGACESLEDRPPYGYQSIGGWIEPLATTADIARYIDKTVDKTTIFVPIFRNLRAYERESRIAYEWLERVTTEGGLCLDVGLRGKMFSSRQLFEVDLTKYARFTYE